MFVCFEQVFPRCDSIKLNKASHTVVHMAHGNGTLRASWYSTGGIEIRTAGSQTRWTKANEKQTPEMFFGEHPEDISVVKTHHEAHGHGSLKTSPHHGRLKSLLGF